MANCGDPFSEDDFYVLKEEEIEEIKQDMDALGVKDIGNYLNYKITEWHDASINIGLVGESGVGKSSFINEIRDKKEGDVDFAPVGLGDTTKEPTSYKHPHNENIIFWDLPGVGTTYCPRDISYFERVKFNRYDFFLILSDQSFSENDTWLAKEIQRRRKLFYFIRTKLDIEIQRAVYNNTQESDVIPRIYQLCRKNFRAARIREPSLFIISNFNQEIGQFDDLMTAIFQSLPDIKRKAMVFSVGPLTHQVIRDKKAALMSRVTKISLLSAAAAMVPFPGLDILFDVAVLVHEVKFYMETFGLDDQSLTHLAEKTGTSLDKIIKSLKHAKKLVALRKSIRSFVLAEIEEQVAKQFAGNFVKFLPVIGTIVSSVVVFGTSSYFLSKTINDLEKDAHLIVDTVVHSAESQVS